MKEHSAKLEGSVVADTETPIPSVSIPRISWRSRLVPDRIVLNASALARRLGVGDSAVLVVVVVWPRVETYEASGGRSEGRLQSVRSARAADPHVVRRSSTENNSRVLLASMSKPLERHLASRFQAESRLDYFYSVVSLASGILLVTLAYYLGVCVLWAFLFFFASGIPSTLLVRGLAGLFVLLVFYESWRSTRKLFEGYSDNPSAGGAALSAALYAAGIGWGPRGIIPLSSGTSRNALRVVADLLCSGPRLLRNTVRHLRRARARSHADIEGCAQVLGALLAANRRVPLENLHRRFPHIELPIVLEQLSWLGGVVFLKSPPQGLTLTESLREELEAMVAKG